jgi:hypothetical protein
MPKSPDLEETLSKVKSIREDVARIRTGIAQAEKNANKKSKTLDALALMGREKLDDAVKQISDKVATESTKFKRVLKAETTEVTQFKSSAQREYNKFSKIYSNAMSRKDGIEIKHAKISKLAIEASGHVNQISKDHTKADNDTRRIKELLTTSARNDKEISDIYGQAQAVSEEINNTYAITLDTSLAGTLVERRNALGKRTRLWEAAYLLSVAVIVAAVGMALVISKPSSFVEVITERLVFVTPLVVVSFVLSRQFTHERKLYEEYAFKAAAAQSLRGYAVLLNDQFKDVEGGRRDVLNFTIDAMRDIYNREPLQQHPTFFHFIFGNSVAKIEAKIDERIEKKVPPIIGEALHATTDESLTTPKTIASVTATSIR